LRPFVPLPLFSPILPPSMDSPFLDGSHVPANGNRSKCVAAVGSIGRYPEHAAWRVHARLTDLLEKLGRRPEAAAEFERAAGMAANAREPAAKPADWRVMGLAHAGLAHDSPGCLLLVKLFERLRTILICPLKGFAERWRQQAALFKHDKEVE
jgi:hypothetical protein